MLVLTRKSREQIQIGDNVVITILRVKGQSVRIGIEAPRDVRVLRSELPLNEDDAEETAASETTTTTPEPETSLAHTPIRGKQPRTHLSQRKPLTRHKASPTWEPAPTPATLSTTIRNDTNALPPLTNFLATPLSTTTLQTTTLSAPSLHRHAAAVRSVGLSTRG